MAEAQEAFDKLKMFLVMVPMLVSPEKGEPLLYIAATMQVVSAALVVEQEESGYSQKI